MEDGENQEEQQYNNQEGENMENPNPENQENMENPEGEAQPEPEPEPVPVKNYAPPNPTIQDCITINSMLPVNKNDDNIEAIQTVIYDHDELLDEFLQKVDHRTTICEDDTAGIFIKCEQNRDGDSYRSPISNKYFPSIDGGKLPSADLRKFEEKLNAIFKVYTKNYYGNSGLSSCYCWNLGDNIQEGFGVACLVKNTYDQSKWDSSSNIQITYEMENGKLTAKYNFITTVYITMTISQSKVGKIIISGSRSKSASFSKTVSKHLDDAVIEHIGGMVEKMESLIRDEVDTIYVSKTKEIIDTSRFNPVMGKPGMKQAAALKNAFMGGKK